MYQRYSAHNEGQTLQHNIHMTHKLKINFTGMHVRVLKMDTDFSLRIFLSLEFRRYYTSKLVVIIDTFFVSRRSFWIVMTTPVSSITKSKNHTKSCWNSCYDLTLFI